MPDFPFISRPLTIAKIVAEIEKQFTRLEAESRFAAGAGAPNATAPPSSATCEGKQTTPKPNSLPKGGKVARPAGLQINRETPCHSFSLRGE
jgi:hypothetical protein